MAKVEKIEALLHQSLSPEVLLVKDESHLHHGHAGWKEGGGTHFRVRVVADCFTGKNRVERHRLINQALAPLFPGDLHALAIEAMTPEEAQTAP